VRKYFVCGVLMTILTVSGQSVLTRQTLLEKVTSSAADIDDDAVLKRTLYAPMRPDELAVEQCDLMVVAAERRVKRLEEKIEEIKPLIEQGIFARNELKPLEEELDYRKRTLDLAASRAKFILELADAAKMEASFDAYQLDLGVKPVQERFDGKAAFGQAAFKRVVLAYQEQFGKALPVSANGETAFHKALGYDHRGRVDVALSPDQPEGQWLRQYLEKEQIPYFAFRSAVAGKASAEHIHIGPPSVRLRVAD
jgi:hypothetical protein